MLVYVIDDMSEMRFMIADRVRRVFPDAKVRRISSGNEAVSWMKAEDEPIKLVVTDFMMPDGSGDVVLLGAREHLPGVPVVLVSGMPSDSKMLKDYDDWFYKDFDQENFHNSLMRLVKKEEVTHGTPPIN